MSEHSWLLKDLLRRWGAPARHRYPEGYPRELEGECRLRDGGRVHVRPVRPDDAPLLEAGFARLSEETIYRRFHAHLAGLSQEAYRYLTHLDYEHHLALVALDEAGDAVGVARYYLPEEAELAEAAVVVADAVQGQGVGKCLLRRLTRAAEARGIAGFEAFVQADNLRMRRMVERSGYHLHQVPTEDGTLHVWFRFDELL